METIGTERHPYDVSVITDQLFIASRPHARHVEHVRGLGVDLVLSMIGVRPPRALAQPPFRLVRLPVFDNPFLPIPLPILQLGVDAAVPVLEAGGRVLVYCRAGRHRSVAMAACILIARGMTADEAMNTIVVHRPVADPHARHIERRIRAFEQDQLRRRGL
jgi:protein tyrosine phosphatase (PTP) superfamily phosphohydrolase (DUF442 family)